jgi:hypothetical protein
VPEKNTTVTYSPLLDNKYSPVLDNKTGSDWPSLSKSVEQWLGLAGKE